MGRRAQFFADRLIAQQPRNARQCLKVIRAGAFGRQQQEHEVHGLSSIESKSTG